MPDYTGANGLRENFRVVGKSNIPGLTSYALASGVAKFGSDFVVPDMLSAKILRSPYAHAKALSIDASAALKIPGVVDVVMWNDPLFKEVGFNPIGGTRPAYLMNEAHHEGAEVGAVVIAENEDLCDEALRALKIEWEPLPFIADLKKQGIDPNYPAIRGPEWAEKYPYAAPFMKTTEGLTILNLHYADDPPKVGNISWSNKIEGDMEAGFRDADLILEYDVNLHAVVSFLPNPPASVAWWFDNMYRPGKNLHIEGAVSRRSAIATMYRLPDDNVIQEGLFQGGKYCDWGLRMSQEITPLLSKRVGRPVRCCNTRVETFQMCVNERFIHVKLGLTKDGLITAVDDKSIADSGAPGSSDMGTVNDRDYVSYYTLKCENISQRYTIIDSNRGFMHTCGQFTPYNWDVVTVGLAVIAEKLGKDPVELARLNLHGPDSKKDTRPVPSFEACIEAGKRLMKWDWRPAGTRKRLPDGRLHGTSFRYQMCPRHSMLSYFCKLEYRDGVVHFPTQGPVAGWFATECFTMIAAEELGLNFEDIVVDYDYRAKHTDEAGGSDGVTGHGWIVKECANILKQKILESAAKEAQITMSRSGPFSMPKQSPLKGYKAEDLEMMDGKVFVKSDPSKSVRFSQATSENITADYGGSSPLSAWAKGFGRILDTMNTSWCEVAVDEETGEVEILKYLVVADPGKVIRRTSLESQIDQAVFFSHGCQLLEEYILDPGTGVKLNGNMIDYRKPAMLDVRSSDKEVLETRSGDAAYGASGISHCLANSHLIMTAIHNATGVWVDPPATPDRLLKALGKC